ncbi:tripartite motif-containing protein 16-like [Oryzias melastigma]|uniref:Tripartite motif-containing protein 16-like n=1 Tax=Oryzias melastigma TaxID=30732 RepID=A0A3B3BRG0_ORYME|nr:tripartite motif-containing protein 16-like [Oryzias melastigma]
MAQKGVALDQETLSCSICLDLLKDPVTIPCGHSYCMKCIQEFWDEVKNTHSCPQCKKSFTPRPALEKNVILAALLEQLKTTGLPLADPCCAGPGDVSCDICSGGKLKAVKSCLTCLTSYCEKHLQPHLDVAPLKKHKLVEPSKNLQENVCSRHDEVMKMFCRTDQKCICYLCSVDEHEGHKIVSAAAERTERQRDLEESQQQIQQRIQDREKEVKLLQQEVEAINHSADQTVKVTEKIFTEVIQLIQKRSCDVKQQIRSQQQTEVRRVKDVQEKMEQEITEMKRRDAELKQLSLTEDHSQFLLSYSSLLPLGESKPSSSINARPRRYFQDVTTAVSALREKLQDILREGRKNIALTVTCVDVLLPEPEPKSRADFLKYSCQITLDPNTAHRCLKLSKENRKVTLKKQPLAHSDPSDGFVTWIQVLSRESLTGRCYWEVEGKGIFIGAAVTYKNINRSGEESRFGFNGKSWALYSLQENFLFFHNSIQTSVLAAGCSRLGVYLDHRAGVLSFYSVSESPTLLHRVQTTFTEPLHAGVWLGFVGDTAEFCKLK